MRAAQAAPGPAVPRRAVLGGLVASAALGGCTRADPPPAVSPGPDVAVLTAAIAAEQRLIMLHEAVLRAHAGLAGRLEPMLAHHREHLRVLQRHYVPGTGEGASAAPVPSPTPFQAPAGRSGALAALRRAESEAAAARAADVVKIAPGMAQLLASIGACEAGHAALLEAALEEEE
ncbi:hypothetical protein [Thermomonospora curvata]|uniref:Uncharacterized protein n=1 Tax=Thermomonospora curvata (strain ATCC 19995 / DSM 43183 / JCM 3096 / KCTC 9072 / NBRC 15933 / NCIMB 10081 / Henssen B9) TaxID=471852 RepID=D1AAF9_THECD|nr:hypothetical protein [Thermomonospora curvata]ACY98872.1 hypothetical protein Tcur_3334 [Thermomonospora curvata DSM 43183]